MPESDKNKGTEPSGWLRAEELMNKYVRDSEKMPEFCKNIMITQIRFEMSALKNAIGSIELAARRGMSVGEEK